MTAGRPPSVRRRSRERGSSCMRGKYARGGAAISRATVPGMVNGGPRVAPRGGDLFGGRASREEEVDQVEDVVHVRQPVVVHVAGNAHDEPADLAVRRV